LRPAYELAQVIDRFGSSFVEQQGPNAYVQWILRAIHRCRTAELGGHMDRCDECGHIRISYNSCRNRHCPKCQNTHRESWIEDRKQDLLPVPYFHVVFTIPDRLNGQYLGFVAVSDSLGNVYVITIFLIIYLSAILTLKIYTPF
jgi:hypothetical protein